MKKKAATATAAAAIPPVTHQTVLSGSSSGAAVGDAVCVPSETGIVDCTVPGGGDEGCTGVLGDGDEGASVDDRRR